MKKGHAKPKHAIRQKGSRAPAHEEPPDRSHGRHCLASDLRPSLGDLGGGGHIEVVVVVKDDAFLLVVAAGGGGKAQE
ncbi:hypothetical protein RRF57_008513 [Xylaria bambusicola]|uniref:Uncharacterized protein n=1 Tax=Xylaria bambusicola TaxID=326684 RepID=A0AAN7US90_9PEZI